jgi:hypothetical protein
MYALNNVLQDSTNPSITATQKQIIMRFIVSIVCNIISNILWRAIMGIFKFYIIIYKKSRDGGQN